MDNDIKLVFGLISYFLLLTFIVTMVTSIAGEFALSDNTGYNSSGGSSELFLNGYAGSPRFVDIENNGIKTFNLEHDLRFESLVEKGIIYNQATCEEFTAYGASWDVANPITSWFWGIAPVNSCIGYFDGTTLLEGTDWDDGNGVFSNDPLCELAGLSLNRGLATKLGCTWYEGNPSSVDFEARGISGVNSVWESLKDIATLRIDFGFENTFLNFTVNFFIVLLPAVILLVNLIFAFRRIVGWS